MQEEVIKLVEEIEAKLKELKEMCCKDENESEHSFYFKTKASMASLFTYEKEKEEVLQELSELGRPYDYDKDSFFISVAHSYQESWLIPCLEGENATINGDYYFDTALEAQNAIEQIGENRIKKYLFGIGG